MNRYSLCFHWYLISKARLPKAKAVGDVVSQKLPINILLFMSISQNLACACCHTGLQSGLSWLSSPDRWSKAQHFLLYTLQKASYIIWRIVLNHQPRYCQEVERRQNSQQSSKKKVGTLENHQVSMWHNSDLGQKPIHWELVFWPWHAESRYTHRHHPHGNLN